MPRPMYRSRSLKRKKISTPSGNVVTHYREKRTGTPHCAECGAILGGVPRGLRPYAVKRLPKTKKRPERKFGGVLCPSCTSDLIKKDVRGQI